MREGPRPLSSIAAVVTAAVCAVAAAGCGLGPGEETGEAELTISRDYGNELLAREDHDLRESDDVMALLDRSAELETRYGGGFVQSIDGISGESEDGRRSDWFFYVNGVESPIGSADYEPGDGDRIWWDHHDWSSVMRVPAVVGSFPEPFVNGFMGERWETVVVCFTAPSVCVDAAREAKRAGVPQPEGRANSPGDAEAAPDSGRARILVGPWAILARDPVARLLRGGPQRSGVFATFSGVSPSVGLTLLDDRGRVAETLGSGAGLVAALRPGEGPPTWVITGTDAAGVAAAVDLFAAPEALRDRFAVATVENGPEIGVPVP